MAQGGVDERAGAGVDEQFAALEAYIANGSLGIDFVFVGVDGRFGVGAAALVQGILSLYGEVWLWPESLGGLRHAGAFFLSRYYPVGLDLEGVRQGPVALAPPGQCRHLLVDRSGQVFFRSTVLASPA